MKNNGYSEDFAKQILEKFNKKIELKGASQEVSILVESYNSMIDELEESAVK